MSDWLKDWEPETVEEWLKKQQEVYTQLEEIEIKDPPELIDGEVLELWRINQYLMITERAFKSLLSPKMKSEILLSVASRWYENEISARKIEVATNAELKEIYCNQDLQKAYAEDKAKDLWELVAASKVLKEHIHSERSRLWDFKKTLENAGHNTRKEAYLDGEDQHRE